MVDSNTPQSSSVPPAESLGIIVPVNGMRGRYVPGVVAMASVSAARLVEYFSDYKVRDWLPEPLDVPDHVGNSSLTFTMTSILVAGFYGRRMEAVTDEDAIRRRGVVIAAAGVLAVGANAFGELIGYGSASTPDALDFAYGILGGALGYAATRPRHLDANTTNEVYESTENDNTRRLIDRLRAKRTGNISSDSKNSEPIARPRRKKGRDHHHKR